ncbi:MAG TPA: hypothetical protein VKZ18_13625 [Polyangia bacterium]|nr:hypothetical protein [Polyangia bacterium]
MVTARAFLLGLLPVAAAAGCSAYPTYKNTPIDCTVESAYDVNLLDSTEFSMAWTSADGSPHASMTADVENIPEGPLCGSTTALVARGGGNNDWGSLFGFYGFGKHDESGQEGLSFWARAPGNTGKGFTVLMDDSNTYDPNATCTADAGVVPPKPDSGIACSTSCTLDGGSAASGTVIDTATGAVLSSGTLTAPKTPNECGNDYQTVTTVTGDWKFYTIPFAMFQQQPQPDRVPNAVFTAGTSPGTAMVTSSILNMIFRFPKESAIELWIDHLGFYRHKQDGGIGQ